MDSSLDEKLSDGFFSLTELLCVKIGLKISLDPNFRIAIHTRFFSSWEQYLTSRVCLKPLVLSQFLLVSGNDLHGVSDGGF